jgi:hypothetical protein
MKFDTINLFGIFWISIVIQLPVQISANQHAAGDTYGKAKNINERKSFLFGEISPGGFEIIFEHSLIILEIIILYF